MTFIELAKKRFSSRDYKNEKIEDSKIEQLIEAARIAPSAANKQPWRFIIIRKDENLKKIYQCYHREWFKKAPVVIIACAKIDEAWVRAADNKNHADVDVSIAVDHLTLQAADLGLATCWICHFDVKKTKELFDFPEGIEPIALLPIAYPNDEPDVNRHDKKRKKAEEIFFWESF